MHTYHHGRHEHGQNFLTHTPTITQIVRLVAATSGPIIEIGPGDGALTTPLAHLGRPLTAVEIDPHLADRLRKRLPVHVEVLTGDFLHHRLPNQPHVLVGNLPFHQTTAMLRRILHAPGWTDAVLLTQWEVARRRAGVGRSTMMTTQWAPWFSFTLHGRVPARAFTPRPGVDGGIITIHRRELPALPISQRRRFQQFVHRVYTGPGHGAAQILARATTVGSVKAARGLLASHSLGPDVLPGDIPLEAWVGLFQDASSSSPPGRNRTSGQSRPRRSR